MKNGPDPLDIAAAQAKVDAIKATLDAAVQIAPFDGTVTEVLSSVGDLVTPGTKAFRVDDLEHLSVDILVTEVDIARIKVGQDATLSFDAILGKEYHGKVSQVAQAGDVVQGVASFDVKIAISDADGSVLARNDRSSECHRFPDQGCPFGPQPGYPGCQWSIHSLCSKEWYPGTRCDYTGCIQRYG